MSILKPRTKRAAEAGSLPTVSFRPLGQQAFPADVPVLEWVLGERADPGDRWSIEGAQIAVQAVVVRIGAASAPQLYVRLGADWYPVAGVQRADPALDELRDGGHMMTRGLSPSQEAAQRRREEEGQAHQEAQANYARMRGEHHLKLRQEAEAREQRARAAIRASSDADYSGSAGAGGAGATSGSASAGTAGRVVLIY